MKLKETLESTPLATPKRAPRLSTIKEWNPNYDAHEEEDNFLESDDEEILKNYTEFLSKMVGKTSVADCPPVEQREHRKWDQMKPDIKAECIKKATDACHVVK